MLLYILDLMPKIFVWKKPLYWKLINAILVTLMVAQLPLTMVGFIEQGVSINKLKIRICSICLSFLLLCEILSIREQRHIKLNSIKLSLTEEMQNVMRFDSAKQGKSQTQTTEFSWCEIVKHDTPGDCWIVIEGNVYDVSDFAENHHPG
jgi:hypothetical protein